MLLVRQFTTNAVNAISRPKFQGDPFMYRDLSRLVVVLIVVMLCVGGAVLHNGEELKGDSFGMLGDDLALDPEVPDANDREAVEVSVPQKDSLPNPGFTFEHGTTALVVTDPQNDFLSPHGVAWGLVGKSVRENDTVGN